MIDMQKRDIKDAIIELLEERGPLSFSQIAIELRLLKSRCVSEINKLVEEQKVIRVSAKNSGNIYYLLNKKATFGDVANMHIEVAKETIDAKDMYEELTLKIESVDKNVNGLYANIIAIMSIFVAIFALITVNANIAFELTQKNMHEVFYGIVVINIIVILGILTLLAGVRVIIINPMIKDKKSKKKEKR